MALTEEDTQKLLDAMEEHSRKVTSSKEAALSFLQDLGILDENGEFTEDYSELGKACTVATRD